MRSGNGQSSVNGAEHVYLERIFLCAEPNILWLHNGPELSGVGSHVSGQWLLLVVRPRFVAVCVLLVFVVKLINLTPSLLFRRFYSWILNSITASLIAMSVLFDFGIWWTVGNLVMFDADEDAELDESKANEMVLKKGPKLLGRRTSEVVLMERRASLNL